MRGQRALAVECDERGKRDQRWVQSVPYPDPGQDSARYGQVCKWGVPLACIQAQSQSFTPHLILPAGYAYFKIHESTFLSISGNKAAKLQGPRNFRDPPNFHKS